MITPVVSDIHADNLDPCSVHLLSGCIIQYDGEAPVSEYFKPTSQGDAQEQGENARLEASFRGRYMKGHRTELPHGYTGFVAAIKPDSTRSRAEEDGSAREGTPTEYFRQQDGMVAGDPAKEQEPKALAITATFDSMAYWNHHTYPDSSKDIIPRSLAWLSLATALHTSD